MDFFIKIKKNMIFLKNFLLANQYSSCLMREKFKKYCITSCISKKDALYLHPLWRISDVLGRLMGLRKKKKFFLAKELEGRKKLLPLRSRTEGTGWKTRWGKTRRRRRPGVRDTGGRKSARSLTRWYRERKNRKASVQRDGSLEVYFFRKDSAN